MKTSNIVLIGVVIIVIIVIAGGYLFLSKGSQPQDTSETASSTNQGQPFENSTTTPKIPEQLPNMEQTEQEKNVAVIGTSVEGRKIKSYHFGSGETEILFVGGIHGGYAPNTVALNFKLIDWLRGNEEVIPENVSVTVIPILNPDGLAEVVGGDIDSFRLSSLTTEDSERVEARFNARGVDLNRNFACEWQPEAVWSGQSVNPGEKAFSEPESVALRDYVTEHDPAGAVVYYAQAGAVYTSSCDGGPSDESKTLMDVYASASGYTASGDFDAYPTSGDATNWMAKRGVTAISVLLPTYTQPAWQVNKDAIKALFGYYSN